MTYSVQQGPWLVKNLITDYLAHDLPRRIVAFREAWGIDDEKLPIPERYHAYEPPALDHWPMIITVQLSTSNIQRIDYADGANAVYRCTYGIRTYLWTRAETPEGVTETRDRLAVVVRAALLDHPCLQRTIEGLHGPGHQLLLDERSLREEYSEVTVVKGDRRVAGAFLSYDVILDEMLGREPIGEVGEIDLEFDAGSAFGGELTPQVTTRIITD